jgi:chromosome partitioning protein
MKTLVCANQKGGVGKTTLVVHLAHYAAESGLRVLVIDLDSQRNASGSLAAYANGLNSTQLFGDTALTVPALPEGQRISLIAGNPRLVDVDRAPPGVINSFLAHLKRFEGLFDLCLIDTPPAPGLRTSSALIAADFAIAPTDLDQYSIDGITALLQTVEGIKQQYNSKLRFLGLLPSRFNTHSPAQKEALRALLANYSSRMFPGAIAFRSSIGEAAAEHKPVWQLPKTAARDAGREMKPVLQAIIEKAGVSHGD